MQSYIDLGYPRYGTVLPVSFDTVTTNPAFQSRALLRIHICDICSILLWELSNQGRSFHVWAGAYYKCIASFAQRDAPGGVSGIFRDGSILQVCIIASS